MTPEIISQELFRRFRSRVDLTHLEVMPWYYDQGTEQTWREHLTNTFTCRLRGASNRGVDPSVVQEMEHLLQSLQKFTQDQALWSFEAIGEVDGYGGWGIGDKIVFCTTYARQ